MSTAPSEPASASDGASKGRTGAGKDALELVRTVVYALLIALVLRVLLFQPFTIPSASMEPTLLEGDYIVVSKFAYGWSRHSIPFSPPLFQGRILAHAPQRGDIVVFKLPRDSTTDYIKRLVGLPGDRIQVKGGVLTVNGQAVARTPMTPETVETAFGEPRQVQRFQETMGRHRFTTYLLDPAGDIENTGVYVIPQGDYFMMGDNRDNSADSRLPTEIGVGFVPADNLEGRADIILFSWKQGASLFKPWTWLTDARFGRFFHLLS